MTAAMDAAPWIYLGFCLLAAALVAVHQLRRPRRYRRAGHRNTP